MNTEEKRKDMFVREDEPELLEWYYITLRTTVTQLKVF